MQVFKKDVLSAPTSFFVFAALRHAVRLACFAAASLAGGDAGVELLDGASAGGAVPAGAAANTAAAIRIRTAVAPVKKRMLISSKG